ncbi:hypothetical protein ES703_30399 [subsurface metagenome]
MRLPKRGEKGFTLIELLIVVAILGVLAAVVIPNVGRFMGRGEEEARRVEYNTVRLGVTALMVENDLTDIPDPSNAYSVTGIATNEMDKFPDITATLEDKGADAAFVTDAGVTEVLGYLLYGNQIVIDVDRDGTYDADDGDAISTVNTVSTNPLTYYYTCEADGTIRQFNSADLNVTTNPDIEEYTY